MESREQLKEKDLKEKRLTNRLRSCSTRIKDIERERIWALATAHSEGLSIRKIAEATGPEFEPSPSTVTHRARRAKFLTG